MMNRPCYDNCIHYGTQFERPIERIERECECDREPEREAPRYRHPLYMRMRRHVGRRFY